MKARLYHLQINVRDPVASIPFYRSLFGYLEYRTIMEMPAGYYAVFLGDPDRLKIEVAHVPGITDRRR